MTPERWKQVKSLFAQALELPTGQRAAFLDEHSPDAEARAEVESLLQSSEQTGGILEESILEYTLAPRIAGRAEFPQPGDRLGVYTIVQQIGEGGMGAVYQALRDDGEFRKLVAVKILKRGMDTDQVLHRFETEKQILAHFDHPHIARVLDAGITPDNRPFFVMEFYAAVPLDTYCNQQRLSIDGRIQLFLKVCDAVQYAHQNLIVHRDLKPGNILVTSDGEPKLLDFGIAKLLNEEITMTVAGFHLMTPDYASPEQLRGDPITTSTDIYSLGIVLYQLLSGEHPFPRGKRALLTEELESNRRPKPPSTRVKTHEARRAATEERPEAPPLPEGLPNFRRWSSLLRGDLDNIVLKALALEPARRYQSVQQLAADLVNYRQGRPVSAVGEDFVYLLRKFVRRNWLAAGAAASVVVALAAGLTVASYQASVANRQRARAERREGELRQLAQTLVFDLHDAIRTLPGATPVREKLLAKATQALDGISRDAPPRAAARMELAEAYARLGRVQGSPSESNLGDTKASLASFRKAVALLEAVPPEQRNGETLTKLAILYESVSDSLLHLGERPEGHRLVLQAIQLREQAAAADPDSPATRKSLAIAYFSASRLKVDLGDYDEALRLNELCLREFNRIYQAEPGSKAARYNVALALKSLASLQSQKGRYQEAAQSSRRAIELDLLAVKANPDDAPALLDLAIDYSTLGNAEENLGDLEGALREYDRSRELREQLYRRDTNNSRLKDRLAYINRLEGLLLVRLNRLKPALPLLQRALALNQEAVQINDEPDTRSRLAETRAALGYYHCTAGERQLGEGMLRPALEWFEGLNRRKALSAPDQQSLGNMREWLGACGVGK
jgi:non-specific serine/threonine protein kinase/serine/threonine-protein kinase